MLGKHHEALTREALRLMGRDCEGPEAQELVEAVTFPDRVRDVFVAPLGVVRYSLLHHDLAGLDHFTVRAGKGRYTGYCWPRDPTASWLELPDIPVHVSTAGWLSYLCPGTQMGAQLVWSESCREWAARHPMLRIAETPGYNAALDEATFASGAVMAGWLEELLEDVPVRLYRVRRAGCVIHLLQDACARPHATGRLVVGHSTYEAQAWEEFLKSCRKPFRVGRRVWPGARLAVEWAAAMGRSATPAQASVLALRRTVGAIAALLPT